MEPWRAGHTAGGKDDRRQKLSIKRLVGEGPEQRKDGQRLPGREMPERGGQPPAEQMGRWSQRARDNDSERRDAAAECAAGDRHPLPSPETLPRENSLSRTGRGVHVDRAMEPQSLWPGLGLKLQARR